jgi:hypothetical protein
MQIKNFHVCLGFFSKQNKLPGHIFKLYVPEILGRDAVIFAVKK